jgi:uncharacterized protein YecE (DUF72 family)
MYKSWANSFYPKGCPAKRHLEFYVTQFPTVEINASFYRLPAETAFAAWRRSAPPGFLYAVKGSRAVTHFNHSRFCSIARSCSDRGLAPFSGSYRPILRKIPND